MVKEVTMYTVICDNCGADSNEDGEYGGWSDKDYTIDCAHESDWHIHEDGEKHYCPNCFIIGDDDEIVINQSRTKQ